MTRKELEKLADKYQAKAEKAYDNYQATGIQRYDRESYNNSELASAMRMAANAEEDHQQLMAITAEVRDMARMAEHIVNDGEASGKAKDLLDNLVSMAVLMCKYLRMF